jgi:tetratricopeptide (TPR) repeat protein
MVQYKFSYFHSFCFELLVENSCILIGNLTMDLNFRLDFKEQGNQALKDGNLELALSYYTSGIEKTPENHELYSNRSLVFYKISKFEKSLEDAEKAISISPKWFKVPLKLILIPKGLL